MIYDKNIDNNFRIFDKKIFLKVSSSFLCETPPILVNSKSFKTMVKLSIQELNRRKSILLDMFGTKDITNNHIETLLKAHEYLIIVPIDEMVKLVPNSDYLVKNKHILYDYIEYLYNFWRSYDRFIISMGTHAFRVDKRPYRTFNSTIEMLTEVIRKTYRDIQENILY